MNQLVRNRAWRISSLLGALALMFGIFASATPALAADDPYVDSGYSIGGTLLNNDEPIANVKITATLDSFKGEVVTNEFGEWLINVPGEGQYSVTVDETTLPAGVSLTDKNGGTQIADLSTTNFAAVLFSFGAAVDTSVPFTDELMVRIFSGLNFGLLLAIAAIGISLIFGTTGLSNFAHGEMVSAGALFVWLFYIFLGWPLWLGVLLTLLVAAALGWGQDALLWRPLRKRRLGLNQMMIVSIGFSIVFRYLLLLFFGGETKDIGGGGNIIQLGPIYTSDITLISMGVTIVALILVALFLTRTRIGKATRAVSDNSSLAAATGIDVERIIRIVWVVAGVLTGLAGILYGLQFQANWLTGFDILLLLFAAVTLGGLGTALGAWVGAMIIGMVVELSTLWISNDLKYAAALIILVLVLIVRPQGVLGKKQRIG